MMRVFDFFSKRKSQCQNSGQQRVQINEFSKSSLQDPRDLQVFSRERFKIFGKFFRRLTYDYFYTQIVLVSLMLYQKKNLHRNMKHENLFSESGFKVLHLDWKITGQSPTGEWLGLGVQLLCETPVDSRFETSLTIKIG